MTKNLEQFPEGDTLLNKDMILYGHQNLQSRKFTARKVIFGEDVTPIHSEADLPPIVNGFHPLGVFQSLNYMRHGIQITTPILFPAGYVGYIENKFSDIGGVIYTGAGAMHKTLMIDGIIANALDSVLESGVKTQIITSVNHGLLDGQYVNITGTNEAGYDLDRWLISNVTPNTFDIDKVFTVSVTGTFNTGYLSISIRNYLSVAANPASTVLDIESNGSEISNLTILNSAFFGFNSLGTLRNPIGLFANGCIFGMVNATIVVRDAEISNFENCVFRSLNSLSTAPMVNLVGAGTRDIGFINCNFQSENMAQDLLSISNNISQAKIIVRNCLDNRVSENLFDPIGRDETDPQIDASGNGVRKSSMTIMAGYVNENTTPTTISSSTFGNIQFGNIIPSVHLERFVLTNSTIGEYRYKGLNPIIFPLFQRFTMKKDSGSTQTYEIKYLKNGNILDDDVILPMEVKTEIDSASYSAKTLLELDDLIKPQIKGIGTTDSIIVTHTSIGN